MLLCGNGEDSAEVSLLARELEVLLCLSLNLPLRSDRSVVPKFQICAARLLHHRTL